jgi:hypothetical protein
MYLFYARCSKNEYKRNYFVKCTNTNHNFLLFQDGFAPPEEVEGEVSPSPNEEDY